MDASAAMAILGLPIGQKEKVMASTRPSPNDQRTNVKNPNNPAYEADRQNRIDLGHGNAPPPADSKPTGAPKQK